MYFHGQGGEDCETAPVSSPGCVVIAVQCPSFVTEGVRCFWFTEGPGGAWDRHEHDKLRRCEAMLAAVASVVDSLLSALRMLHPQRGVERHVWLVGVSMGGCGVLEFARAFPTRVRAAAVIAGCYNDKQIKELAQATWQIPLLLVHSRGDRACPFGTIEKLYVARAGASVGPSREMRQVRPRVGPTSEGDPLAGRIELRKGGKLSAEGSAPGECAETEAWFSEGQQHTPTE
eukprot:CAMPEP_0171111070 /NCGR_PEP_ID=MMETSP0766_2-20121228/73673_1 /TAXON_ID=439317 /ORGANISM="Gambierdiscus australes, Strain CAWD 149" /LENGTH=230 /DNA_ID=CAMNT_0011573013 /DNA_START=18 /DNA_END=707 /DNA_ORIENTATION=+